MAASLKIPLGANFAGRIWVGLLSFVATPLYVRWLGVEAFGVVGFYLLLQAISGFFSAGIMDAANREIAAVDNSGAVRPIIVGFGRLAWIVGLAVGAIVAASSGLIAHEWLSSTVIAADRIRQALWLAAALLAMQVPLDYYVGVLLGLRRHTSANVELAGTATMRFAATVVALSIWPRTLATFFAAQLVASVAMVLLGEWLIRWPVRGAVLPPGAAWAAVRASARFSGGMTLIALSGMVLSQADRIVLSRALRLDEFGVYSVATTLANLLYLLIAPVRAVYFPEFTRRIGPEKRAELAELYHRACLRLAALVLPVSAVLIFFARDILALWTSRPDLAERAAPVVMFLVAARVVSAINGLPYTLQFAFGWTGLVAKANGLAIVILLPVLYWLALHYGAVGAAAGYFILSVPFLVVIVARMHRRVLVGEMRRWAWSDTGVPLLVSFGVAALCKSAEPAALGLVSHVAWLAFSGIVTLATVVLIHPRLRSDAGTALFRGIRYG